jgi:hypothetical protein
VQIALVAPASLRVSDGAPTLTPLEVSTPYRQTLSEAGNDARLDEGADEPLEPPLQENGGFDLALMPGWTALSLGAVTFEGDGLSTDVLTRQRFEARGAALGLHDPGFWSLEFAASYTRRFLAVGAFAGFGSTTRGAQVPPLDPAVANTFDGGNLAMFAIGGDLAFVAIRGPATVRAGALIGVRYLTAQLGGTFQVVPCDVWTPKSGSVTSYCVPRASATIPMIQPRVTVDYSFSAGPHTPALGAYLGIDTDPGLGWSIGATFSYRVPFARLAP